MDSLPCALELLRGYGGNTGWGGEEGRGEKISTIIQQINEMYSSHPAK